MAVLKQPTKEDIEKFGVGVHIVQFESNRAVIAVEGPGTTNFLKFLEGIAAQCGVTQGQGKTLTEMFN